MNNPLKCTLIRVEVLHFRVLVCKVRPLVLWVCFPHSAISQVFDKKKILIASNSKVKIINVCVTSSPDPTIFDWSLIDLWFSFSFSNFHAQYYSILSEYFYRYEIKLKLKLKSHDHAMNGNVHALLESMGVEKPTCRAFVFIYLLLYLYI